MMNDPITGRWAGEKGDSLLMMIDPITGRQASVKEEFFVNDG